MLGLNIIRQFHGHSYISWLVGRNESREETERKEQTYIESKCGELGYMVREAYEQAPWGALMTKEKVTTRGTRIHTVYFAGLALGLVRDGAHVAVIARLLEIVKALRQGVQA